MSQAPAQVNAISRDGKQFVPLKTIVEQLGGTVDWDNAAKIATINVRNVTAQVFADQNNLTANGQTYTLSAEPFVENNTLYVPIDLLHDIGLSTG
jgi:hypothetical protein